MWKTYTGEILFRLFRVEIRVFAKAAKSLKASEFKFLELQPIRFPEYF